MKKLFLSSILCLAMLSIGFFKTTAADKTGYFARLLSSWDIDIYTLNENVETKKWELPKDNEDDFLLLTTNQMTLIGMNLDMLLSYNKVILVCDTSVELSKELACSFDGITTTFQKTELASDNSNSILNIFLGNTNLIVIPEAGFVLPKNTAETTAYFEALAISRENKAQNSEENTRTDTAKPQSVVIENSELIGYLVFLLLFNFIVVMPIKKLSSTGRVTLRNMYTQQLGELKRFVDMYEPFSKYLVTMGICVNIIVGGVFLLNNGLRLLLDAAKTLLATPTLADIVGLEIFSSRYALVLVIVNILLLGVLSPMVIDRVIANLNIKMLLPQHKIKDDIAKWIVIVFGIAGIMIASTGTIAETHHLLTAVLLVITYILFVSHEFKFTVKEKLLATCVIATVAIVVPSYSYYSQEISIHITEEKLFSDSERIVVLPYKRVITKNTKIKEFTTGIDFPIFIEHQLIYHPSYPNIVNKNIESIDLTNNYMVVTKGKKDYINTLLSFPILLKHVEANGVSEFFYTETNFAQTDTVAVKMTIDCSKDTSAKEIYLEKYRLSTDPEQFNLLIFPGCTPMQKELTYTAPIDTRYMQQPGIFQIQNFSKVRFSKIVLQVNGVDVEPKYIKTPNDYQQLGTGQNKLDSTELYVYSQETEDDTKYKNTTKDVNIGSLINTALETMNIENNFVMWSSAENAIIKNVQ